MPDISYRLVLEHLAVHWRLDAREVAVLQALGSQAIVPLQDIEQTLDALFAVNPELAALWPTTPNRGLDNRSPLDVIAQEGMAGLENIHLFVCLTH